MSGPKVPTWDSTTPINSAAPGASNIHSSVPTWDETENLQEKYGSLPQEALTVLEGAAKGYAGPVATGIEKALSAVGVPGLKPEDQEGREAASPTLYKSSEVGGLGAGFLTGTGEARVALKAGEAAATAARLGKMVPKITKVGEALQFEANASRAAKAGAGLLRGAVETATFQAGEGTSKRINHPDIGISDALTHIGLSAAIGGAAGGVFGSISPLWEKSSARGVSQGITDLNNSISGSVVDDASHAAARQIEESGFSKYLSKQKQNAAEIIDIGARNDWPVFEGMTSDSKVIQRAEDALLHDVPTIAGLSRQKLYGNAMDKATSAVDRATNASSEMISETQAGNALKESLTNKLGAEYAPIKQIYQQLEENAVQVPIHNSTLRSAIRELTPTLEKTIEGTPRRNYMQSMMNRLKGVGDLNQLKEFRTEARNSAGIDSKDLFHDIYEALKDTEVNSIKAYAKKQADPTVLNGLIDLSENARAAYKPFIQKLQTMGKSMGRKNLHGPQDFIDFVDNMNPQTLAKRLFNEKNTEFTTFFAKNFPEEMGIMRDYQRGLIREASTKEGVFSANSALKKIDGMEPEMQKLLYSQQELNVLKDAKTYLGAFPKNFNPSGTSHESAFRQFFEHPTGAVLANLRDSGILAFIKAFGKAVPGADLEASKILPTLASAVQNKEVRPGAFKHAVEYAVSAAKGEAATGRATKSIFRASIPVAATVWPSEEQVKKLDKRIKDFVKNPDLFSSVGGGLNHYLPNHDISLKGAVSGAVGYLESIRPKAVRLSPLGPEIEPTPLQIARYHRALAIAEKPLSIVSLVREGRLTAEDVKHLSAIHPGIKNRLSEKIIEEMTAHIARGEPVPYKIKIGLSTLLGQPLDSSLFNQNVMSNQATFQQADQQDPTSQRAKPSVVGMRDMKISNRFSLSNQKDES